MTREEFQRQVEEELQKPERWILRDGFPVMLQHRFAHEIQVRLQSPKRTDVMHGVVAISPVSSLLAHECSQAIRNQRALAWKEKREQMRERFLKGFSGFPERP